MKIPDRKAETMVNAIVKMLSSFPPQLVKTITCDRGTEFANGKPLRSSCIVMSTSLILIVLGKKAQMKIPMDFCESFIQKGETFLALVLKHFCGVCR